MMNETGSGINNVVESSSRARSEVLRVAVKPPVFNREDPEVWFTQLEAQFTIGGVTVDETKYSHLLTAIDADTVKCVREKILAPPPTNKYGALKQAIVERLTDSARTRLDLLLKGLQLGDKKPSQLLREMQALAGNQIQNEVLQNLWLQRLPHHCQEILSSIEDNDLDKLAQTADKISEVNKSVNIYATTTSCDARNNYGENNGLAEQVAELTRRINEIAQTSTHYRRDARSKSRPRSRNRTPSRSNGRRFCYYHSMFWKKAKRCEKPCDFDPNFASKSKNENTLRQRRLTEQE